MIQNLYFWLVLVSISLTNEMFITCLKKKKLSIVYLITLEVWK